MPRYKKKKEEPDPTQQTAIAAFIWMRHSAFHAQASFTVLTETESIVKSTVMAAGFMNDHVRMPFFHAYELSLFVNLYNLFGNANDTHSLLYLLKRCDLENIVLNPTIKEFQKRIHLKQPAIEVVCKLRNNILAHSGRNQARRYFVDNYGIEEKDLDDLLQITFDILDSVIDAKEGEHVEPRAQIAEKTLKGLKWLIARSS